MALWPTRVAAKSLRKGIFPTAHPDSAPPTASGTSLRLRSHPCSGLATSPCPVPGTPPGPHPGASEERQEKLRWGVGGGRGRGVAPPSKPHPDSAFPAPPHGAFLALRFPLGTVITAVIRKTIILAEWEHLNLFLPPFGRFHPTPAHGYRRVPPSSAPGALRCRGPGPSPGSREGCEPCPIPKGHPGTVQPLDPDLLPGAGGCRRAQDTAPHWCSPGGGR